MTSIRRMTDDQLQGVVQKERAKLQKIKEAHLVVGEGLPHREQQAARESVIRMAAQSKERLQAANAELVSRKNRDADFKKRTMKERMTTMGILGRREQQRLAEEREDAMIAERVEHLRKMKECSDERNAEAVERQREAHMLYEPIGTGGGWMVAALFSCATLWDLTEMRLRENPDKPGTYTNAQVLNHRDINMLFWACGRIEEQGGVEAYVVPGRVPHWLDQDGELIFRTTDLQHLCNTGFLEWDRSPAGGPSVIRYGSRSKQILEGFMEMLDAARNQAA